MASIRARKNRDGTVTYQVQVRREGFKPLTDSFRTRAEAERWGREQDARIDRGGFEDTATLRQQTVKALMKKFLEEKVPHRKGRRWEEVRLDFLMREEFALRRLDQDVVGALQEWAKRRSKEVSGATVVRDLTLLSSIFTTAMKEWRVPLSVNPVSLVKRPVVDKAPKGRVWTKEDLARLKEAALVYRGEALGDALVQQSKPILAKDFVVPALELSIETAMRRGELCALLVKDIDLEARTAWLPPEATKTAVGRHVLLSTRAVEIVKELLQVPRRAGEGRLIPVEPDTLGVEFRELRNKAGLKGLRLHDGRHTAATRASKVFDNVLELAAFTGHTSLQTLKRYYHPDPEELAKRLG